MLIRPAIASDAGAITALYIRTRRLAYESFFPPDYLAGMSVEDYTKIWEARLSGDAPAMQTFVAESDDALAGFTYCGVHDCLEAGTGEIEFMYVAPEQWRSGLGSILMQYAIDAMAAQRLISAILWVYRDNERARRFYERVGWAHDGDERDREIGASLIRMLGYRRSLM